MASPDIARAPIDFGNTEIAFQDLTDTQLERAYWLFKTFGYPFALKWGPGMTAWALRRRLPVRWIIKETLFNQFCGGETFQDCRKTIGRLARAGIRTMLDYAVEARQTEEEFERTSAEVLSTIRAAREVPALRFVVIKLTGMARLALLENVSARGRLDQNETREWERVLARVERLCRAGAEAELGVFIDAEESWIEDAVDEVAIEMMAQHNRDGAVVYHTVQMYRRDRLDFLKKIRDDAQKRSYRPGIKLVRGAYLEKERQWAASRGREPAVHARKEDTDRDFHLALQLLMDHLDGFALCAATHNEASTEFLLDLMRKRDIAPADSRIEFSQLQGMGNHLTYNLAHHGYNASKYLPYGPVDLVLPYLFRRAEENSSIRGTTSRELALLSREMKRRGLR